MSTFYCSECGMLIIDTPRGKISGCEHYQADVPKKKLSKREKSLVLAAKIAWEKEGTPIYPWGEEATD